MALLSEHLLSSLSQLVHIQGVPLIDIFKSNLMVQVSIQVLGNVESSSWGRLHRFVGSCGAMTGIHWA